jgi:hypothetical protein
MNFRAIDPRDQRAGLEAGGATDRAVWEEFYDPTSEQNRTEDLEAEFERLWPEGTAGEPQSEPLEEVVSVSTGRRGQGYIADPRVRQAVEHRAMELAAALYQPPTFTKLRNTSKTRPFDFICSDAADHEIRVEVKGSTGALTECQLTVGEVNNANGAPWRTDLVLVRDIRVVRTPDGPRAEGGEVRVIEGWVPKPDELKPIVYRYTLPEA